MMYLYCGVVVAILNLIYSLISGLFVEVIKEMREEKKGRAVIAAYLIFIAILVIVCWPIIIAVNIVPYFVSEVK